MLLNVPFSYCLGYALVGALIGAGSVAVWHWGSPCTSLVCRVLASLLFPFNTWNDAVGSGWTIASVFIPDTERWTLREKIVVFAYILLVTATWPVKVAWNILVAFSIGLTAIYGRPSAQKQE